MTSEPSSETDAATPSVKALVLRSASWAVGGQILAQGLRLLSNIILTRLLFPEAFGLMAIVGVFIFGLHMFSDLGVGPSIIYSKRGEDPSFLNTAWTIQVLRGAATTVLAVLLAWPVAEFYDEPQLRSLLAVTGFSGLIQGFNSIVLHTEERAIRLGRIVQMELASQLVTIAVMVVWALLSPTVWALVAGSLTGTATKTLLSHFYLPRFRHRFHWEPKAGREIYNYGSWIFLSSIFTFIGSQGDRLLFGYYLSMAALGVYSVATRFSEALIALQTRLTHSVLFPFFSRTAREDRDLLVGHFYRIRFWTDLVFLTVSGVLAATGDLLIGVLYDARYAEAGWILQALAIQVGMSAVLTGEETLLFSLGKTFYGFARSLARAIWIVVGIPLGWNLAGMPGVVWCVALSEIPVLVVIWIGMAGQRTLRPLLEARSFAVWVGAYALGSLVKALIT